MPFSFKKIPAGMLLLCLLLYGCQTLASKKNDQEKKLAVELKKQHFAALFSAIQEKRLVAGSEAAQVKNLYGEPDDNYSSGTVNSLTEIWTYEKIDDKSSSSDVRPVRLFFENRKLISWSY